MTCYPTFVQMIDFALRHRRYRIACKAACKGVSHWCRWTFMPRRAHAKVAR